jgi:hypothetical protein
MLPLLENMSDAVSAAKVIATTPMAASANTKAYFVLVNAKFLHRGRSKS